MVLEPTVRTLDPQVSLYEKRISGPLLDCIDIHVEVPRVEYDKLTDYRMGEKSEYIRARMEKAREVQRQRFASTSLICNADMGPAEVREFWRADHQPVSHVEVVVATCENRTAGV